MRVPIAPLCLVLLAMPASAGASSGGAASTPPPTVTSVKCQKRCADGGMAKTGSRVLLRGTDLLDVVAVGFVGSSLEGDEVATTPISTRKGRLAVKVPKGAATGP